MAISDSQIKRWIKASKVILLDLSQELGEVNNPWIMPLEYVVFPSISLEEGLDCVLAAAKALSKDLVQQLSLELSGEPSSERIKTLDSALRRVNSVVQSYNSGQIPKI